MLFASRLYLARSVFELHVKGDAAYECNRAANSRSGGVPISGNRYDLLAHGNQSRQLRRSQGYSDSPRSTGKKSRELLGSKSRRRLPRSKGRLVDGMAQGRAITKPFASRVTQRCLTRSRGLLCVTGLPKKLPPRTNADSWTMSQSE